MTSEKLASILGKQTGSKPTIKGDIERRDGKIYLSFPDTVSLNEVRENSKGNPLLTVHFAGPQPVTIENAATRDGKPVDVELAFRGAVLNLNLG